MKLPSIFLFLLLSGCLHARGQESEQPAAGFLSVMNLVSLKTPTYMTLQGFEFNGGEPIAAGEGSGTLALKPGDLTFEISNPGAKPDKAILPLKIENGRNIVVVCYDEVKTFNDGTKEVKLLFSVLIETTPIDRPKLTVVSLLPDPRFPLSIDGRPYNLAPKSPVKADLVEQEPVVIRSGGRELIDFEVEKPGHYIVFVFVDPETGSVSASLIQNQKLEYQPPLGEDDE